MGTILKCIPMLKLFFIFKIIRHFNFLAKSIGNLLQIVEIKRGLYIGLHSKFSWVGFSTSLETKMPHKVQIN